MEELIANRYVNALNTTTTSEERAEYSALLSILAELYNDKKMGELLTSPLITSEQKMLLVWDGLGGSFDSKLENFIRIISENGRLDLIPVISKKLKQMIQKEKNEYEGVVTSSHTLGDAELADLEASLKKYTGSTIKLTQVQSDLDGIKVSVEDLGIEVNFSKQRVKEQLIDFITKSL